MNIPQYEPKIDYSDLRKRMNDYLTFENSPYLTEHKLTRQFEKTLAEFLGTKHAICVNNGTISLSLALLANGVQPGDRVLVPSISMIATANAVRLIGAVPVFTDVDSETGLMTELALKNAIDEYCLVYPPVAVIYVSLNGRSRGFESIKTFCNQRKIALISDDAQSFGSKYENGNYMGNWEGISSFSLSMPKIITTGQGGFLTTNNDNVAELLNQLKNFGRTETGGLDYFERFGINSKFTDLQAIVGLSQMLDIDWRTQNKKLIQRYYKDILGNMIGDFREYETPWFVELKCDGMREEISRRLRANGIGTRDAYKPMYKYFEYITRRDYEGIFYYSNAERWSEDTLWLPSSLNLSYSQIKYICDLITSQ